MAEPELCLPCEHGRYETHGGCGVTRCREEEWYTDPQPDMNGLTPVDRATRHDTPQKGYWADPGFEYSPLYWEPCHHLPKCEGGRCLPFDEMVERIMTVELDSDLGTLTATEARQVLCAALNEGEG